MSVSQRSIIGDSWSNFNTVFWETFNLNHRRLKMMSVTGGLPAYVKFAPQLDKLVTKPFYNRINTNCSSKCSLHLQFGSNPFQRNSLKRRYCKTKDQDTPFSSDSPWESGDVWTNLALYLFTLHIPLSFGGLSVVSLLTGQQPLLHPQTQVLDNNLFFAHRLR